MTHNLRLLLAFCLLPLAAGAQNLNVGFGKNRVQYHHQLEEWQYYETPHFTTYWYGDARNVAITALQMAEQDYNSVQQLLEHQLTDRVELLVFSDLTDLKQSNIGSEDLFLIRTGETKVVGNMIFVHFDGNHQHLHASVREGLAGVMINSMLYGSNLQEIVQNAVLLNLPGWYTEGLQAYCGNTWDTELDDQLRDLLATNKIDDFDKLARQHPRLAGHAFWYYVAQQFGPGAVSNLLYLTRINRGLDAGFRYVIGSGYDKVTAATLEFYRNRYRDDARFLQKTTDAGQIKVRNKRNLPLYQLKVSPDGRRIAWVQNDLGKWAVWQQDLRTGKRHRLLKGGIRNAQQATDYQYPLLTWHPDNQRLAVLYERRDVPKLALIDTKTRKKEVQAISPEFQRVFSMDFTNPVDLVFSAAVRGLTDLYIYHTANRQTERLTQDFWDDLDATCITLDGRRSILWSSNRVTDTLSQQRLDTILPTGHFDLFLYDLESRSSELIRLTHTPVADDKQPVGLDSTHFVFLTDENGVRNRAVGHLEPYVAYYKTTFYLKNGAEATALDTHQPGEWPLSRALTLLAPADSVRRNLDSTLIDSVRTVPVWKKRAVTRVITNYDRNIAAHDLTSANGGRLVEVIQQQGKTRFFSRKIDNLAQEPAALAAATKYRESTLRAANLPIPLPPDTVLTLVPSPPQPGNQLSPLPADSVPAGWFFQMPDYLLQAPVGPAVAPRPANIEAEDQDDLGADAGRDTEAELEEARRNVELLIQKNRLPQKVLLADQAPQPVQRFNPSRIVPYRLKFRTDFVSTNLDNSLLFEGLDSYAGSPAGFRTPPPGVLLRANFKELLENYVIEAGFRLPTSFNGAEYYIWLDDRKRRLDRRYALYRKTLVSTLDESGPGTPVQPYQVRTNSLLAQYEGRYPLDPFLSLRAMATLRQDKTLTLTSDQATLETPDYAEQRAAVRVGAVYDNTVDVDVNLKTGSRARFYVEAVKRFEFNTQPDWSFKLNSGFMTVVNLDARHYQRIDRRSILALRVAAASTFGSEKILYYLGGVDNWLIPRFNDKIPVPQDEAFAYQTLAAHLRGFRQNIRNGNSFALFNGEVRVPIFKYFSKKPVMGNFWRNFQITGFFDAGTAWVGRSPFSGNNPINEVTLTEGPDNKPPVVIVNVKYFRDPLVAGYGVGLRMPVFGMYLRADYAWGIETRVVQKPMFYLALGADF